MATRRMTTPNHSPKGFIGLRRKSRKSSAGLTFRKRLQLNSDSGSHEISMSEEYDDIPGVLDPILRVDAPTEILSPMQIYPTENGRHIWSEYDWFMTSLGFLMNVTTIVRFPYLCAKYGGVIFLIPYFLLTMLCAIPCCYAEVIIGQFTRTGALTAWKICPLFKGIGLCCLFLNFLHTLYNNAVATWGIAYAVTILNSGFGHKEYDWSRCDNQWNSMDCVRYDAVLRLVPSRHDSNEEYFRGYVMGQDAGKNYTLLDFDVPNRKSLIALSGITLFIYVAVAWIKAEHLPRLSVFVFGSSSSFLSLLVIRSSSLPGGVDGLTYYFAPHWNELINYEAWVEAGRCVFCSYGIGLGVHLTFASFNPFSNQMWRNVIIPIGVSTFYSLCVTISFFSLLGFSARIYGRKLHGMTSIQPEFIFEYLPTMIDYSLSFPSHFYFSIIFLTILLTSVFNCILRMASVKLCIEDQWHSFFDIESKKLGVMMVLALFSYILAIPLISRVGVPWTFLYRQVVDGIAQPFLIFLEMFVFSWIFGVKDLNENHISMTGQPAHILIRLCWKIITPILALMILGFGILNCFTIRNYRGTAIPLWASTLGISFVIILILIVIITAIHKFIKHKDLRKDLKLLILISPDFEMQSILESNEGNRQHCVHYLSFGSTTLKSSVYEPVVTFSEGGNDETSERKVIEVRGHEDNPLVSHDIEAHVGVALVDVLEEGHSPQSSPIVDLLENSAPPQIIKQHKATSKNVSVKREKK